MNRTKRVKNFAPVSAEDKSNLPSRLKEKSSSTTPEPTSSFCSLNLSPLEKPEMIGSMTSPSN